MTSFWILVAIAMIVGASALWGVWGLAMRDLKQRAAATALLENQIAELKRRARRRP